MMNFTKFDETKNGTIVHKKKVHLILKLKTYFIVWKTKQTAKIQNAHFSL